MSEEPKVEEQLKDEKVERVNAFLSGYKELVEKHKIDFATYPLFVPDGQGGFKVIIQNTPVDITNQPQKSPFVAQE